MHNERIHGNFDFHLYLGDITMQVKGSFTIHVNPAPPPPLTLSPTSGALPDETVGATVTGGVSASGGTPPYKYAVTGGTTLPPGVMLDENTGQLSGSPTVAGDGPVEITASDVNG